MTTATASEGLGGARLITKSASGWSMAMAVVFILLGIFAVVEPGVAGLAVTLFFGWLLIVGGVAHWAAVISGGGAERAIWRVLVGIVYIVGGVYFVTHPLLGLGTLTLLLAAIILAEAAVEVIGYFRNRAEHGSGLAAGKCGDYSAAEWADLVPVAVEFGVGDRDSPWVWI